MPLLDPPPAADDTSTSVREPSLLLQRELVKSRTVLIFGEVSSELAHRVTAELVALASRGDEPIRVLIHSHGGHVEAGDTIHDVVRFIRPKVVMIGSGWVASAGALIYCAAERENRLALPNTRFLLH
jgi:ATP-dependent Clp protease protease subunit